MKQLISWLPTSDAEDRLPLTRGMPRRMALIRTVIGLATGLLALGFVMGSAASALPKDPNSEVVPQDCSGEARAFLHPGAGWAVWEVTTGEVTPGPNYLIKSVTVDFFDENGNPDGSYTESRGNKTGRGEPFPCTFVLYNDNGTIGAIGTAWKVALP